MSPGRGGRRGAAGLALTLTVLASGACTQPTMGPDGSAAVATTRPLPAGLLPTGAAQRPTPVLAPVPTVTARATGAVVASYLPFGEARRAEMAAYSARHYGDATWRLTPTMIVVHHTAGASWEGARDVFAPDLPNLGELPNTCAHYVVDRDGTVHALVPTTVRCRHTIGLNDRAIGVEVVQPARADPGQADREILARAPQREALLALVRMLQAQHHIPAADVIGHAMANADPHFHDRLGWRNDHVDWQAADVLTLRSLL